MTGNNNKCGTCTLCCRLTTVPELNKPFNKWCINCDLGKGCLIYEERPESCKNYRCIWLSGGLPEDLRPDKSKVIFERLPSGKTYLVICHPDNPDAWQKKKVKDIIGSFLRANRSVVVGPSPAKLFVPKGRPVSEVKQEITDYIEQHALKAER